MKKGSDKSVVGLLKNEYFVRWVTDPNEESNHYWSKWLNSNPDRKNDIAVARQIILSAAYKNSPTLAGSDYDQMLSRILEHSQDRQVPPSFFRSLSFRLASAAAVLLMAFFITMYGVNRKPVVKIEPQLITKTTRPGQRLFVRLPDNTSVVLNADSKLEYAVPFEMRNVALEGEAFFEVVKDPAHPFTVESQGIRTTVLGTAFNVKAYPGEIENSVSVAEGKVEILDTMGHKAFLLPNHQGVFNREQEQLLVGTFSAEKVLGWKDWILVFEEEPLKDVFARLERWYGVSFTFSKDVKLSGEYSGKYKNASLEKVLDGIGYTSGFEFQIDKNLITIKKSKLP